ncbi:MAG: ABC-type dipeptide transport system, periplasmic component [Amycolatopsis sp.]|jgi:peptide/nickel transport system substrate-binding protein|uniref:ABC transporter substrate-binding protein n=1 Tax=Amycolatopsis sp. TaxID=37632 RepID=UPI002628CF04|nr:ABC transporter substrate-binding protein [Amycolatopsis sp.]MCU1681082.1 ABC-type dipeptide transport system, periplasmic component [Amycolatopsis sp.]
MVMPGTGRRTFLKGLGATAAAALAMPILNACSGGTSTSVSPAAAAGGKPVKGGKAILAIQDNPVNLDPADGQLYSSLQVYQNIFSELLTVDSDFTFKSNLASSWQQEDEKTWIFHLVDNAVFQNGEPFTAQDVAYTVQRMKPKALGPYLSFFNSVEVVDPHTCRIHLAKPYGPMEATMASLVDITNEKAISSGDPKQTAIGTGPYKLTEWVKGSHVTLSRWDKYFKSDRPYLDEVTFQSVGDDTVRLTGLQTGQFDWIQAVPAQQSGGLQGSGSMKHSAKGAYFPYLMLLNTTAPPFNDIRVRQAVNWAIDRSEIVKLAFFGTAVEATEAVSAPNPFYSGQNPYQGGPDLDKAKSLLSQAGVKNVDVTVLVEQEAPAYTAIAQVLQSQLAKIGINLHIDTASSAQYFGRMATQKYGIAMTYFSASLDPALTYYLLGYSTSGFNLAGYKSPRLDSELAKFTFESDQKVRKQVYPGLVSAFAEESPFIFLANQQQQYWTNSSTFGAEVLPSLEIRAEDMWKSA